MVTGTQLSVTTQHTDIACLVRQQAFTWRGRPELQMRLTVLAVGPVDSCYQFVEGTRIVTADGSCHKNFPAAWK
jgi:hypothetical protein